MKKVLSMLLSVLLLGNTFAFAHSGKTDSSGGHRDNKNKSGLGSYHYHCGGNEAHLHKTGKCPYAKSTEKPVTKPASKSVTKPVSIPVTKSVTNTPAPTPSIPSWAKDSMKFCTEAGYFNNLIDKISNPNVTIQRSIFITALYNLSGIDIDEIMTSEMDFIDVPKDSLYYYPVAWGIENNIIQGTSNTNFSPDNYITREQVSIIINNFLQYKHIMVSYDMYNFNDYSKMNTYALDAINNMQALGILTVDANENFRPQDYVTVAELSKIMQNILTAFKNLSI